MNGFLKLQKSEATVQLMRYPAGFMLLTQIAMRAKRDDSFNLDGLTKGQALIGDHEEIGISQREYRTAKEKLTKWGLCSFKATNKGTIATILKSDIYDINEERGDKQETIERQTSDNQETTNKKERNKEIKENIYNPPASPEIGHGEQVGKPNKKAHREIIEAQLAELNEIDRTAFLKFEQYARQHWPRVSRMPQQMTPNELVTLRKIYGDNAIIRVLGDMDNYKKLGNYLSVGRTASNWLARSYPNLLKDASNNHARA